MSLTEQPVVRLRHLDRFFIGGEWVVPSSEATITVTDSATEQQFFSVAEAQAADIARAVGDDRHSLDGFDNSPDPWAVHLAGESLADENRAQLLIDSCRSAVRPEPAR